MHRYYLIERPADIGTFPNPCLNKITRIENYDNKKYVKEIDREAWGNVEYQKSLTAKEISEYELTEAKV